MYVLTNYKNYNKRSVKNNNNFLDGISGQKYHKIVNFRRIVFICIIFSETFVKLIVIYKLYKQQINASFYN